MDDLLKSLLFEAVIHRKPILFDPQKGEFKIGLSTFSANAKVIIKQIEEQMKEKPYTLFEVYYFLLHYDKPVDRYMAKAREDNVRFVAYLHREKIFTELFPGVQPTKFNPAWLLEAQVTGPSAEEPEEGPIPKKARRGLTEEELSEWQAFLTSYDETVTGATEISRHWHASEGPPKVPTGMKQIIQADRQTADTLYRLQKPVVSRLEGMRVTPGPRMENVKFFEDVLEVMKEVRQKEKQGMSATAKVEAGRPHGSVSSATAPPAAPPKRPLERDVINPKSTPVHAMPLSLVPKPERRRKTLPIIIVPNAPSSLIDIFNARDFLEEGVWIDPCEKKIQLAQAFQGKSFREDNIIISSSKLVRPTELAALHGKFTQFRVTDSPHRIKPSDWDFVCGCFVLGTTWQFRTWFSESPVEIFNRLCGFHLTFTDDQPHPLTSKWSVTQLRVGKQESQRHMDRKVAKEFWQRLYRHLRQSEAFRNDL
eukprot:GGOE01062026.1.p1 GENE.GGOE01062026.1~~GGOE01062026.1.p1  ORF type:complete len:488 (+),score=155.83 GGOE01062026.1:26-1465(+)